MVRKNGQFESNDGYQKLEPIEKYTFLTEFWVMMISLGVWYHDAQTRPEWTQKVLNWSDVTGLMIDDKLALKMYF